LRYRACGGVVIIELALIEPEMPDSPSCRLPDSSTCNAIGWRSSGHTRKSYTAPMQRGRSLLAALMILWLPLQGFAAVAMPFCKHGFHASASEHMTAQSLVHAGTQHVHRSAQSTSDSHQHHAAHAGTHDQGGSSGSLACNDCGACHLACSPAAPTSASAVEPVGAQSFTQFSPTFPPLFVPEQRTPPPLAAIA
jgi:ferredoxin